MNCFEIFLRRRWLTNDSLHGDMATWRHGRGGGRRRHSERERDRMATANGRVMREMEAWGVSANLRTNNDFDRKVRLNPHGGRLLKPTLIIIHRESLDHLTFFLSNSIQGLTLTGGRNSF